MIGFLLLFTGFISFGCNMGLTRPNVDAVAVAIADFKKGQDENIVALADFGVTPNSFENASAAVKKAIAFCKTKKNVTFLLPGGRIDLWPEGSDKAELYISNSTEDDSLPKVKNIAFFMDGFTDFTIDGNNTLVVLHGKMVSFAILNSENIHIKNLQFDYERPTMSELTIVSASAQSIEATVHPGSKYWIDKGKLTWYGEGWKNNSFHAIAFRPGKEIMQYSSFKPFAAGTVVQTSPLHLAFSGDFSPLQFEPGDVLTVRDPYRDNCGAFINLSKNIRIEQLQMHYMHGLGIVSQFSENISLLKVAVAPRKNSGRIISSFADCFHFSGCRGKIVVDSCFTSGSHDDPVNVHGTHLKIVAIEAGKKIRARFMHHQTWGFSALFANDSIVFVNPQTLVPVAYASISKARLVNKREMEFELTGALPHELKAGDCVENTTWTPEVIIRNSRFERTNTRGLLITTRKKVLIENNIFFRTGMHAILIADDALSWYESGPVQDVTIRNNVFEECGYNSSPGNYVIAISPENHQLAPGFMVHQNIRIENNIFKVYDYPILTARSTGNLIFRNNAIIQTDLMRPGAVRPAFMLTACENVIIEKNDFKTNIKPAVRTISMSNKELKTDIP